MLGQPVNTIERTPSAEPAPSLTPSHSLSYLTLSLSLYKDEQSKNKREKVRKVKEKTGRKETKGSKISTKPSPRAYPFQSPSMVSSRALTPFFLKSSLNP